MWTQIVRQKFNNLGLIFMSKCSNEFKLELVKYYLEEHYSFSEYGKKIKLYILSKLIIWF